MQAFAEREEKGGGADGGRVEREGRREGGRGGYTKYHHTIVLVVPAEYRLSLPVVVSRLDDEERCLDVWNHIFREKEALRGGRVGGREGGRGEGG